MTQISKCLIAILALIFLGGVSSVEAFDADRSAPSTTTPIENIDRELVRMENQQQRGGVENVVLEDQVVDWVLEQVKTEDEEQSFDDLLGGQAG